jgi:hypothetical protein
MGAPPAMPTYVPPGYQVVTQIDLAKCTEAQLTDYFSIYGPGLSGLKYGWVTPENVVLNPDTGVQVLKLHMTEGSGNPLGSYSGALIQSKFVSTLPKGGSCVWEWCYQVPNQPDVTSGQCGIDFNVGYIFQTNYQAGQKGWAEIDAAETASPRSLNASATLHYPQAENTVPAPCPNGGGQSQVTWNALDLRQWVIGSMSWSAEDVVIFHQSVGGVFLGIAGFQNGAPTYTDSATCLNLGTKGPIPTTPMLWNMQCQQITAAGPSEPCFMELAWLRQLITTDAPHKWGSRSLADG